jgi:FAD/FMN-containing dehydrogenase
LQSAQPDEALDGLLESALGLAMEQGLILDAVIASSLAQREALWRLRECISESMAIEGAQVKHDVSVPIVAMPEFAAEAEQWILQQVPGARVVPFGHIGDGNLHFNVSQPPGVDGREFLRHSAMLEHGVHDIAHSHGGSFSAEHGIGKYKLAELQRYRSATELDMMRALKRAFDPRGIMNPGKVLP